VLFLSDFFSAEHFHTLAAKSWLTTWHFIGSTLPTACTSIEGDVSVRCEADTGMGRSGNVSKLINSMPLDPELLPQLIDATLSTLVSNGFVLSCIEYIDGCAYAQS